jgi:hypothetical protein
MNAHNNHLGVDQPLEYQIKVQGRLEERWSHWFDDLEITVERDSPGRTLTVLTGVITDQAALHGLLNRIRDLNLLLVSVQLLESKHQRSE